MLVALYDAARRYPLPLSAFEELIDGCVADVRGTTYRQFDELLSYCRSVAGSIGRLSLGVFGTEDADEAVPLADALGVALQITKFSGTYARTGWPGGSTFRPRTSNGSDAPWTSTPPAGSPTRRTGSSS